MKHRERVLLALNHKESDRCPMQISFTPEFASRLKQAVTWQNHPYQTKFDPGYYTEIGGHC
jgi:hypothetical protein